MTALKQLNILKSLETLKDFHSTLPASTDEGFNKKKANAEKALSHLSTLFETTSAMKIKTPPRLAACEDEQASDGAPHTILAACEDEQASDGAPHTILAACEDEQASDGAPHTILAACEDEQASDGAPYTTPG